jgi:hypothetical protein
MVHDASPIYYGCACPQGWARKSSPSGAASTFQYVLALLWALLDFLRQVVFAPTRESYQRTVALVHLGMMMLVLVVVLVVLIRFPLPNLPDLPSIPGFTA